MKSATNSHITAESADAEMREGFAEALQLTEEAMKDVIESPLQYRRATPAENMQILKARLSEHLSPAEKRELDEVIAILLPGQPAPVSETARIYKKPAECAVACPPQQVCDYCQSQPKDKPAELAPSPNTTDDVFKTALREIVAPILEHKPGGLPAMMDLVDKVLAAVRKHAAIVALLEDRADQRNAP